MDGIEQDFKQPGTSVSLPEDVAGIEDQKPGPHRQIAVDRRFQTFQGSHAVNGQHDQEFDSPGGKTGSERIPFEDKKGREQYGEGQQGDDDFQTGTQGRVLKSGHS